MALQIGNLAPDFDADTTEGRISFYKWLGKSWCVLFSHPKDFTPVCTTELGCMARLKPEFDKRNTKIIGLSVDPVEDHTQWATDIEETQGYALNYPLIADTDLKISRAWSMLPGWSEGSSGGRTAADNQTVRNVFVIGPDKRIKLILIYPMTTGRNFDEVLRVLDALQLSEARRGRHHRRLGLRRGREEDLPAGVAGAAAVPPDGAAAGRSGPTRTRGVGRPAHGAIEVGMR
jgi:alkyl hydroperoxide reductase subunit AhpC